MPETKKYKVLAEVEIDGAVRNVDDVVELTTDVAAPFVDEGKLEEVSDEGADSAA